jgi:acetyltransferase-like isoleucine patch superfamily enzyme
MNKLMDLFKIIRNSTIDTTARVYPFTVVKNSSIGKYSYISYNCIINNTQIRNYSSIAHNVKSGLGRHPTTFPSTSPLFYSANNPLRKKVTQTNAYEEYSEVKIGNDVWIGTNVVIADGVSIGNGAIVGANSLVTKSIPAYCIVGGVPAKPLKYRFEESIIERLIDIKWWEQPIESLIEKNILELFKCELTHESLSEIESRIN